MDSGEDLVITPPPSHIADRLMRGATDARVATRRWTVSVSGKTARHKGTLAVGGGRSISTDPDRMSR